MTYRSVNLHTTHSSRVPCIRMLPHTRRQINPKPSIFHTPDLCAHLTIINFTHTSSSAIIRPSIRLVTSSPPFQLSSLAVFWQIVSYYDFNLEKLPPRVSPRPSLPKVSLISTLWPIHYRSALDSITGPSGCNSAGDLRSHTRPGRALESKSRVP